MFPKLNKFSKQIIRTLWYNLECRMLWKSFKRLKCLGLTSTSVPSEVGAHSCLKNSFQPHYLAHSFVGWSSPPKNTLFKKPALGNEVEVKRRNFSLLKLVQTKVFYVLFHSILNIYFQKFTIFVCGQWPKYLAGMGEISRGG